MIGEGKPVGTVTIGNDHPPTCVLGNAAITVPGKASKLVTKGSYMLEIAAYKNLPSGVVVNCCYVRPKAGQMAVILINTTDRNI